MAHSLWQALRELSCDPASDGDEGDVADAAEVRRRAGCSETLSVQPVGTSRVVRLSYEYPDPAWAQRIANAVANTFVSLTLERRFEAPPTRAISSRTG